MIPTTRAGLALAAGLCVVASACGDDGSTGDSTGSTTTTTDSTSTSMTATTGTDDASGTSMGTSTTSATSDTGTTAATDDTGSSGSDETTGGTCPQGEIICEDNEAKTCDGMGGFEDVMPCGNETCVEGMGCLLCQPGSTQCNGDDVEICNDAGDGWDYQETCDGVQGVTCDAMTGECIGECAPANLGLSYIGCDYYPTVTPQHDNYHDTEDYAVAVSNTTPNAANVTIERNGMVVVQQMVPADAVQVITLPWVDALTDGFGPSKVVPKGAYRLRSDQPVTVYQYNPLTPTTTNDASLLLPVNTWGASYVVASYNLWHFSTLDYPGFYAVTAREDATTVTLSPSPTGQNVQAGGGVQANGTGMITIDEGDVLLVETNNGAGSNPDPSDLTGTIVDADKPIQVIGGHKCTNVPSTISACDHLEESMFPIDTLAKEYIVVPPVQYPNDNLLKGQIVRVIATEDDTDLTFDPPQPAPGNIATAGEFVELSTTTAEFVVSSDKKILVAQYMVGQSAGFGQSDPALLQAVATEQYRDEYRFHAPTGYDTNYLDIIAPGGAQVTVDGVAVGNQFTMIANTGFSVAHIQLSNANQGNHNVIADEPVGISVYGIKNFGTYWYPGGLDLELIPQ